MYETAGASNVNDLLDKFRVFALASGWTVDFSGTRQDTQVNTNTGTYAFPNSDNPNPGVAVPGNSLVIHKGDCYAAWHTDTRVVPIAWANPGPYLLGQVFPGPYSGAVQPQKQAGCTPGNITNKLVGPFQAYHFFSGDTYLHAVVEITPGEFRHFGCGLLERAGAVTSGAYVTNTHWNQGTNFISDPANAYHAVPFDALGDYNTGLGWNATHIRADSDAVSPRNIALNARAGTTPDRGGWGGYVAGSNRDGRDALGAGLLQVGPSTLTGRSVLVPLIAGVTRPDGFGSVLGTPRDMRAVRIDNLAPGDAVTIGPDTWLVFPCSRKNGVSGQENSRNAGLAYRVNS